MFEFYIIIYLGVYIVNIYSNSQFVNNTTTRVVIIIIKVYIEVLILR